MEENIDKLTHWTFPYNTCEIVEKGAYIAQPYSFTINTITAVILVGMVLFARTFEVKFALLSYAIFEAYHACSHAFHINSEQKTLITHSLAYLFFIGSWMVLSRFTKHKLSWINIYVLLGFIIIDIFVFFVIGGIWNLLSFFLLIWVLFMQYIKYIPKQLMNTFLYIITPLLVILCIIELNEVINCQSMLNYYKFPYHIIVEFIGMILFLILAGLFLQWEVLKK